jgi:signal transduction histidine kinase
MTLVTTNDLRSIIALQDLPDDHLQWIIDRSELKEYKDGDVILKLGDPMDYMVIILEGEMEYYRDVNNRQVYYFNFKNDATSGGISCMLPYSRMKTAHGYGYSVGKSRFLFLHKKHFQELEKLNLDLIQRLIGYMTERARFFATTQLQHEKVNALGKLSAGIAHELNNPAAAINRISSELSKRLNQNYILTEKLLVNNIRPVYIQNISQFVNKLDTRVPKIKMTALERMDIEDNLNNWLEQKGITSNHQISETLAESGITEKDLDHLMPEVNQDAFLQILVWLENLLSSQRILKDLEEASSRISNLVGAMKSHVQMDRTNELQPTNIHDDIENTLTLLGYKIRDKNIRINKIFADNMPEVPAYIGELNQVWTNIIDNAIFALDKNGELVIETSFDERNVNIKIIDNGCGIPQEIQSQIFDPFFTTKKVGEGTGIGLDLVKRIVKRHEGDIKLTSNPGMTEFKICIPIFDQKNKS